MIYYSEWDLAFLDIFKNGSNVFRELFRFVTGRDADKPFFIREPQIYMMVVRNPYDRLVSQFYHINKWEIIKNYRYTIHYPFFRDWVKETYSGEGYTGNDGHYFTQAHITQYYKYPLTYKVFKMEELIPHQLFFFLDLDEERKVEIDEKCVEIRKELDLTKHHAHSNLKQGVWQSFYDSETLQICNRYFANDFKAFNYTMLKPSEFVEARRGLI